MYLRAAIGLFPRPRPSVLPTTVLRTTRSVDRAHLARYADVCGFRLGDTLPPTYPFVLAFPDFMHLMTGNDFPFPAVGLVHIGNRITQARPIGADEELDFEVCATDLRPHRRGRQFDLVTIASVGGTEVWRSTSTMLRRGAPSSQAAGAAVDVKLPDAQAIWRVTPATGTSYAAASGDHNPIHTSRIGARLFGFPRPIAHGMWTKARCLASLEGSLPSSYTVDVEFKAPILLPSTVNFAAPAHDDGGRDLFVFGKKLHLTGAVS
jgi:acyl dehydratase